MYELYRIRVWRWVVAVGWQVPCWSCCFDSVVVSFWCGSASVSENRFLENHECRIRDVDLERPCNRSSVKQYRSSMSWQSRMLTFLYPVFYRPKVYIIARDCSKTEMGLFSYTFQLSPCFGFVLNYTARDHIAVSTNICLHRLKTSWW